MTDDTHPLAPLFEEAVGAARLDDGRSSRSTDPDAVEVSVLDDDWLVLCAGSDRSAHGRWIATDTTGADVLREPTPPSA
jgi:hypothetical protein